MLPLGWERSVDFYKPENYRTVAKLPAVLSADALVTVGSCVEVIRAQLTLVGREWNRIIDILPKRCRFAQGETQFRRFAFVRVSVGGEL